MTITREFIEERIEDAEGDADSLSGKFINEMEYRPLEERAEQTRSN